jgi:valyl-tRNA synthetase
MRRLTSGAGAEVPPTIVHMTGIPDKPTLTGLEARWSAVWEDDGIYRFDRSHSRAEIFSIDTPPPTVSGSLHMGSAFGYVQTDAIARYQRMRGRHVFYPMGWDDNGLPTERRVQNYYGVRSEPLTVGGGVSIEKISARECDRSKR